MSMVFQGIGLMPWKSIFDNVALGVQLQAHRPKLNDEERERIPRLSLSSASPVSSDIIRTSSREACSNASGSRVRSCASPRSC